MTLCSLTARYLHLEETPTTLSRKDGGSMFISYTGNNRQDYMKANPDDQS